MKKTISRICLVVLTGTVLITCKNDDEPICPEFSLEAAYPFAGPADGPVLIKGTGFNEEEITVRFGNLKAEVLEKNKNFISTKVPPGLLGLVELSVSNAQGCIEARDFEVSGANVGTTPGSPPVYFIPPSGFAFPVQVPLDATVTFKNVYDDTHSIVVNPFASSIAIVESDFNFEKWADEVSPISGSVDLQKNEIVIKINRSGKPDDELIGSIYTMSLTLNGVERLDNFFVAFSTLTGRQYLFSK
jgi:hypothetical protein